MKNIWFGITVCILVVIAVVYFNNNYVQAPAGSLLKPVTLPQEVSKIDNGQIIFVKKINQNTLIQSVDTEGKAKTLFTDQDEKDKISSIGNFDAKSSRVALIMGKSNLVIIDLNTAKKDLIGNNFTFPDFVYDFETKEAAYISFSNVEKDYGYSILVDNFGGNIREIYRTDNEIANLGYTIKGISFIEDSSSGSELKTVNPKTKAQEKVYTAKNEIIDANTSDSLIIEGLVDKKSSQLGLIQGSKIKVIYENRKDLMSSPVKLANSEMIAFLALGEDLSENGIIYIVDQNGKNIKKIEQGIKILGWIP